MIYSDKKYGCLMTGGVFDLLHVGHVKYLETIKDMCDYLIVLVSPDDVVAEYKYLAPIISFKDRMKMIKSLKCVDEVLPQKTLMNVQTFIESGAQRFVLPEDWRGSKRIPRYYLLNKKIIYLPPTPGISTSIIKEKIIKQPEQILKAQMKREFKK